MGSAVAATETLSVVYRTEDLLCRMAGYFRKLGGAFFTLIASPVGGSVACWTQAQ